tara:strand:+ start:260 stop:916 length:657 start_codon:yes stop_codon:yes gene_type:complete
MSITANINDIKWELPERLTIEEWRQLQQWEFENPAHWPWIINTISSIPAEEFNNADPKSMQLFMGFIVSAMNLRTLKHQPKLEAMKFGQFVDLDCFVSLGMEKHIQDMLDILEVDTPWANEALASIEQYIKWRTTIYKQYAQLFDINENDSVLVDEQDFDPKEVPRSWYKVIVELAGKDILKMDQVTEEPLHKVLTFLQIKKEEAVAAAHLARKQKIK